MPMEDRGLCGDFEGYGDVTKRHKTRCVHAVAACMFSCMHQMHAAAHVTASAGHEMHIMLMSHLKFAECHTLFPSSYHLTSPA